MCRSNNRIEHKFLSFFKTDLNRIWAREKTTIVVFNCVSIQMFEYSITWHITSHLYSSLLTLVMMFKSARPSITCQTFFFCCDCIPRKRQTLHLIISIEHNNDIQCSIDRRFFFNASATHVSKWRHWLSKYLNIQKKQIFVQKKGTRWICWHIHYVVIVYQIIKLNKCLKDVKKTISTLRLEIHSSKYDFFSFPSLSLDTQMLGNKQVIRFFALFKHWFFIRLKIVRSLVSY